MKAIELKLQEVSYTMSANTFAPNSHYKMLMRIGRVFPTTKAQAIYFIQHGVCLDFLNAMDVNIVEKMLNEAGFEGLYRYTKSKTWVRLENNYDLHKAIKLHFEI